MKSAICILIGHAIDPMDSFCEELQCWRCKRWFEPRAHVRDDIGFWLWWWGWRRRLRLPDFLDWHRCAFCGRRFKRHHPLCVPF